MEIKIIEPIGLCASAYSILDKIKLNMDKYNNIYILGDILHNEFVINYLSNLGIKFVKDINDIKLSKYSLVILPSHGTSPKIIEKLKKYNYLDLTCPKIKKMHEYIISNNDKEIIFLGKKNHAETLAVKDYDNVYTINSEKDIDKLPSLSNPILMCQTTLGLDEFNIVSEILKNKYPNIIINNNLCNIPLDRINNIKETECDLLLVIGSKTSSNANEICNSKPNSMIIGRVDEIDMNELRKYKTIAVASASSTPLKQVNEIVEYIKENA